MPQIPRPSLSNSRPIDVSDPRLFEWGRARRKHPGVARYRGNLLPGFVFQRQAANNELTAALQRLEDHLPTPGHFFLGKAGLIGYQDMTNARTLLDPSKSPNRWRIMDLLGRAAGYLADIEVGETFIPGVGNLDNLAWGHPNMHGTLSGPYFNLDTLPTLAVREAQGSTETPYADAVDSLGSALEDVRIPEGDQVAWDAWADLEARVAQLLPGRPE